jgi:hypothetical protein
MAPPGRLAEHQALTQMHSLQGERKLAIQFFFFTFLTLFTRSRDRPEDYLPATKCFWTN